jgi:hypothetical protein
VSEIRRRFDSFGLEEERRDTRRDSWIARPQSSPYRESGLTNPGGGSSSVHTFAYHVHEWGSVARVGAQTVG